MSNHVKAITEFLEALQDGLVDPEKFAAEFRREYKGATEAAPTYAIREALRRNRERNATKELPVHSSDALARKVPAHIVSFSWAETKRVALWAGTLDGELNENARRRISLADVLAHVGQEHTSWLGASLFIFCEAKEAVIDVDVWESWPTDASPEHLLWIEIKGELGLERVALSPTSPVATVACETIGTDPNHWHISMGLMPCK